MIRLTCSLRSREGIITQDLNERATEEAFANCLFAGSGVQTEDSDWKHYVMKMSVFC
jgi:hypothetical protein